MKQRKNITKVYKDLCEEYKIPFEVIQTVNPYDDTTLFCPAGMQKYKAEFKDKSIKDKTVANVQSCIRMNDFNEIGDDTHSLHFNMIGLFSFRDLSVKLAVDFFMEFLKRLGLKPSFVTVHPDRAGWANYYKEHKVSVLADKECKWTDGEIEGYCTEFYINGVEVGNIVNPRIKHTTEDGVEYEGNCIDVGFGLERLDALVNGTPTPSKQDKLKSTILAILESGYVPGPKQQGYVLRRLIRELYTSGGDWYHPVFAAERERQQKLKEKYEKMKGYYPDKSREWWYDTHGIVLEDM